MFKFLSKLFSGKTRTKERKPVKSLYRIRLKVADEYFILTDFSAAGFAGTRELSQEDLFSFINGDKITVDFIILGHKKATVPAEIRWIKGPSFGAVVTDALAFQKLNQHYLNFIRTK